MRTARTVVRIPGGQANDLRPRGIPRVSPDVFGKRFLRLTGPGAGGGVVTVTLQTRPIADIATMDSKAAVI